MEELIRFTLLLRDRADYLCRASIRMRMRVNQDSALFGRRLAGRDRLGKVWLHWRSQEL
jgi:hypothetical protein